MQEVISQSENMLIKYAVTRCAEDEGNTLNEENTKLKLENVYPLTQKNLKTLRKTLQKKQRSRSRKRKNILKFVGGYVAITVVLVSSFIIADAVHEPLSKFLTRDAKSTMYFDAKIGNVMPENIHVDWKNIYLPQYLPAGAIVTRITSLGTKYIGYTVDGKNIDFTQYLDGLGTLMVDNEGVIAEKIEAKDFKADCTSKNNVTNIVWEKDNALFLLSGPTDLKTEMIEMAKSITYVE